MSKDSWTTSGVKSSDARYYVTNQSTKVRVYPSSGANNKYTAASGTGLQVLGKKGDWYKVSNTSGKQGYCLASCLTMYKTNAADASVSVSIDSSVSKDLKKGSSRYVTGYVSSKYPLRSIVITAGSSTNPGLTSTKKFTSYIYKKVAVNSNWDFVANINLKKLTVTGTRYVTVTATDCTGKKASQKVEVYVYDGSVAAPTIAEKDVSGGKNVTITRKGGTTLKYKVGSKSWVKTTSSSVTVPLTSEGKTKITALDIASDGDVSKKTERTVTVSKCKTPDIEINQTGKTGTVRLVKGDSKDTLMYRKGSSGAYSEYGKTEESANGLIPVSNNDEIWYYAQRQGCVKSEVESTIMEFAEPAVPEVKLLNSESKVGVGKSVTASWKKDKRAESYTAVLYKGDEEVDKITTSETTVSFKLEEEGNYSIGVSAENELGASAESDRVEVEAVKPLKVVFRDVPEAEGASTEESSAGTDESTESDTETTAKGKILAELTVPYGDNIEPIKDPSRKGYTFTGWEDEEGVVSQNGYTKEAVKKDREYTATYSKKTYKVRFYDTEGTLLDTKEVEYAEAADTSKAEEKLEESGVIGDGERLMGWSVKQLYDQSSNGDIKSVDSDMDLQAVIAWKNPELPVEVTVLSATPSEDGRTIDAKVKLTTDKTKDVDIYLVASLKAEDKSSHVEQTVYSDRKIFVIPKKEEGDESSGTITETMSLKVPEGRAGNIKKVDVMALECKEDNTTGSAYSEMASKAVTLQSGYEAMSDWSSTEPEQNANGDRLIEEKTQYRYRDKKTVYSGKDSVSGYSKVATQYYNSSTGKWQSAASYAYGNYTVSTPSTGTTYYDTYKKVVTDDTADVYKSYAYYCSCKKVCWSNSGGSCKYCGNATNKLLTVYSTKSLSGAGYTIDSDNSYDIKVKTLSKSSPAKLGTIHCMNYQGTATSSFTTNAVTSHIYLWKSTATTGGKTKVHRTKTAKIRNEFRENDWSAAYSEWSDTAYTASATRQVETRKMYRYADPVEIEQGDADIAIESQHIEGNVEVAEDLNGKIATVMVYQSNNLDPNKYQMQYTGQIVLGEGNSYSFDFIPMEAPTAESGNYIVSLGIQGTTGLINVGVVEAPKATYDVKLFYKNGEETVEIASQKVKENEDVRLDEVEIPEREGYYFAGWGKRTNNITSGMLNDEGVCEIEAVYLPVRNSIVFVDWVNETLQIEHALTGDKIQAPGETVDTAGYTFRGWKLEDGTIVDAEGEITVTGDMVISAEYDKAEYTVHFMKEDGQELTSQTVEYGEAATPPEYEPASGSFAGWSTNRNWWNVEADVYVYPIIIYDEITEKPTASIKTVEVEADSSEETDSEDYVTTYKKYVELKAGDEEELLSDVSIYYTTDGEVPTSDMIAEYVNTPAGLYMGSINEYTEPVTFEESTEVIAVAIESGKSESEPVYIGFDAEDEGFDGPKADISEEWNLVGDYEVKVKPGYDVDVKVSLEENPGIKGYDFMIICDDAVFDVDRDEYYEPVCEAGEVSEGGVISTTAEDNGYRFTWRSENAVTDNGNLFGFTMHAGDEAEEGMYTVSLCYAPERTLDEEGESTSLDKVKIDITSQASIDISTLDVSLARTTYAYEGKAIEPAVNITDLKEGEDYEVEYANNTDVGTATATISGKNDYAGKVVKEFTITQASIQNAEIAEIGDASYTGSEIKPEPVITYGDITLTKGTDYELEYADNTGVGTATVTVKGKGNFKGTTEATFEIVDSVETRLQEAIEQKEAAEAALSKAEADKKAAEEALTEAEAALEEAEQNANTSEEARQQAESALADARSALEEAEASVEELREKLEKAEEEIEKLKSSTEIDVDWDAKITLSDTEYTYTGEPIKPGVTVQTKYGKLEENVDYTLEYVNNTNAGTAKVVIKGTGTCTGQTEKEFKIKPATEFTEVKLSYTEKKETGAAIAPPELTVIDMQGRTLQEGRDYSVSGLEERTKAGEYDVKVSFTGNYSGEKVLSYSIIHEHSWKTETKAAGLLRDGSKYEKCEGCGEVRNKVVIPGYSTSYVKSFKVTKGTKSFTAKWSKQSAKNQKKFSGYQVQYSRYSNMSSAKYVTASKSSSSKKISKLSKKKKYYVRVRTYTKANGKIYYSKWSSKKAVTTK